MSEHSYEHLSGEMPGNHTYQLILIVVFLIVWILDSFVLHFTTFLQAIIPIWAHVALAIVVFATAVYFMDRSHKDLFDTQDGGLATSGVYSRVRHPMYLGTFLIYLALAIATLSFASLVVWGVAFGVYDVMASYEERLLEERFGEELLEYKKKVRKWLPI
ncbi:MAG: methyltransferase family protein [Candidatus Thorarchaeota archaeon]|jgi:protein-S-isoprenylcysteine O-methyltransferase Ste14